jgi:hypothetical protein
MNLAKFGTLIWSDVVKGFFTAALTTVLLAVVPLLQNGKFPDLAQLKVFALSGLAAGIAYIIKNLLTNSKDELLKTEPK